MLEKPQDSSGNCKVAIYLLVKESRCVAKMLIKHEAKYMASKAVFLTDYFNSLLNASIQIGMLVY